MAAVVVRFLFGYNVFMNLNVPPKDYQTLFLDMNSFFASVEQQVRPDLRGKPIGVAPFTGNTGCIIAASREAKAMGVKIGRISEMKNICPQIKIVESRPALYMIYHKEIKSVIESFTPYFEPLSIDEFVLYLTPGEQNYKSSVKLGQDLKAAIKERVGDFLTCSVGIGSNRFLAKMAGERKKPDGLTVVKLSELKKFYQGLELTDVTGINYRLAGRLNLFKIHSPADLFNCSIVRLRQILNHPGRLWYYRLRGYEVDDSISGAKTIGHSHVLPPELRSVDGAKSVIRKLIFKAGRRLRAEKYWASGVSVCVYFWGESGFKNSFSRGKKVPLFCDTRSFSDHVFSMLRDCRWGKPSYVSVSAFGLHKMAGEQISLISEIEKQRALSEAIDLINDQYGAETVFPASMFLARGYAPDRIPFGSPRYEIIH